MPLGPGDAHLRLMGTTTQPLYENDLQREQGPFYLFLDITIPPHRLMRGFVFEASEERRRYKCAPYKTACNAVPLFRSFDDPSWLAGAGRPGFPIGLHRARRQCDLAH